jgi:hypothetical protein
MELEFTMLSEINQTQKVLNGVGWGMEGGGVGDEYPGKGHKAANAQGAHVERGVHYG